MIRPNLGKLHMERRALIVRLASAVLLIPFSFAALQLVGLDDVVKLVMDALWLLIAALPLLNCKLRISRKQLPFVVLVSSFFLYTIVVYLFRYQSVFYYFWGLRNNFRFYIFFFAVASCFREEDCMSCLVLLDRMFWPNAVLCLIQFILGYRQDNLGGVFGVSTGCNGYMLVYLVVVICKVILEYMNGTASVANCFSKCAAALTIAAGSELKFFFFLFVFVLVLSMVLTAFSFRKVFFLCIGSVLVSVMAVYLGTLYDNFEGFFSLDALLRSLTLENYATANDMGRFNAINFVNRRFLQDTPSRIFGLGLGNCDTSSMAVFNTPFFRTYEKTHYTYFTHAMIYIENGYAGLAMYISFFVLCFAFAVKRLRKHIGNRLHSQMAVIISLICFALIIYGSSLRMETGYMIYFVLAFALVTPEEQNPSLLRSVNI